MARVLVIDDEASYRSALRRVLSLAGHETTEAADGAAGILALRAGVFDAVLLDMFMPHKEGIETLQEILRERPGLPVIAMSGGGMYGQSGVLRAAQALGAYSTLPKPVDERALLAALDAALE